MTNDIPLSRDLVVAGLCLAGVVVRTTYELLKRRGRVDTRNNAILAVVFVAMCLMLASWPVMTLVASPGVAVSGLVRGLGFGLVAGGLCLAIGGVVQLRGLENIEQLVTTGLYARLRHPMYTGFILWILGWALASGTIASLVIAIVCVSNVLYWRWLEEGALRAQHGESYRVYGQRTWF